MSDLEYPRDYDTEPGECQECRGYVEAHAEQTQTIRELRAERDEWKRKAKERGKMVYEYGVDCDANGGLAEYDHRECGACLAEEGEPHADDCTIKPIIDEIRAENEAEQ